MINVKKLDGRIERYDEAKLRRSLFKSGADQQTTNKIMDKVKGIIYNGIETKKLFKFVFKEFKKSAPYSSAKYNLKNAILRLGKEGYAFEKLVSIILKHQGYSIKLNQIVKGKYIKHEIDVSAEKGDKRIMVECKHHIKPWLGCNIQTALYVYARFIDVKKLFTGPMLVTNTRFSPQVITYSKGIGLKLMGWKYPLGDSLEYYLEKFKLYPITMLPYFTEKKISELLRLNILLVYDLCSLNVRESSKILKISKSKTTNILEEAKNLCKR